MPMDQRTCWHTCSWYQGKFPKCRVPVKKRGIYSWSKLKKKQVFICATLFPDTNPSHNQHPPPALPSHGFPDSHRLSEGGWNTVSGSQALGPLQQSWGSLKSRLMELKNWRPRRRNNLNCSFLRFLVKKGRTKTTTKILIINLLLFKNPSTFYINPSRFNMNTLLHLQLHQPPTATLDPAWQVPLDDKFQGLRLENRLTAKDPSRFWPGTKMGWWLAGSGACLRYITCLQVSEHDDINCLKRLMD